LVKVLIHAVKLTALLKTAIRIYYFAKYTVIPANYLFHTHLSYQDEAVANPDSAPPCWTLRHRIILTVHSNHVSWCLAHRASAYIWPTKIFLQFIKL